MTTLVVIPAFNEEDALAGVLEELRSVVPELDVLVVDDGSTDGTAVIARAMRVPVARLPFNVGVGGALRTGFRYAVEREYERAVQFDGDGQHDPHEIKALLAALDAGADMVIGGRFTGDRAIYKVGKIRWTAMRVMRGVLHMVSGQRFSDTSSGFRAFSRPMLEYFSRSYPAEYLSDTVEALLLATRAGYEVVEVPVEMRERSGGQPTNRNVRLLYHYLRLMIVLLSNVPMRSQVQRKGPA